MINKIRLLNVPLAVAITAAIWGQLINSANADEMSQIQLPLSTTAKFLSPQPPAEPGEHICGGGRHSHVIEHAVLAPMARPTQFVCILQINPAPGFSFILNPRGFDYGTIPDLSTLSEQAADSLFGKSTSKNIGYHRYELVSKLQEPYVIDLRFSDGCVNGYRIFEGTVEELKRLPQSEIEESWQTVSKNSEFPLKWKDRKTFFPRAYIEKFGLDDEEVCKQLNVPYMPRLERGYSDLSFLTGNWQGECAEYKIRESWRSSDVRVSLTANCVIETAEGKKTLLQTKLHTDVGSPSVQREESNEDKSSKISWYGGVSIKQPNSCTIELVRVNNAQKVLSKKTLNYELLGKDELLLRINQDGSEQVFKMKRNLHCGAYTQLTKEDMKKFFPEAYKARYGK